ncbi:MAG: peptidase S41, partial [Bacteroidales bacterium]|nr:peptidase S41 [Bacteroidales bacterium]
QSLLSGLLSFAGEKGITYNEKDFRRSQHYIEVELKAYIARNILDNEGFYPLFHQIDEVLKAAMNEIKVGNDVLVFGE